MHAARQTHGGKTPRAACLAVPHRDAVPCGLLTRVLPLTPSPGRPTDPPPQARYRKLSTMVHPDKNPHPRAGDAFQEVKKAYDLLMDSNR